MADNVVQVVIRAKDEASAEMKKFQGNTLAVAGALTAIVGAATAVSVSLFKIAESAAKNGEEMLAFSQKIGLSVEATSRLKYAAEQSETSIETMRVGLRFLAKNAAEAGDELAAVGIKGQNTRELLLSAADAFSKMSDGPAKAALAIKVFGRAGTELLPLLNQGASGIEALEQKADALRITMSSAAAVMGDEFNDSVATVKAQIDGLKTRIASALLPTMTDYVGKLSEVIAKTSEWAEANQPLITANFKVAASITAIGAPLAAAVAAFAALRLSALALGFTLNPLLTAAILLAGAGIANFAVGVVKAREMAKEPIRVRVEWGMEGIEQAQAALAVTENQVKLLKDKLAKLTLEYEGGVSRVQANNPMAMGSRQRAVEIFGTSEGGRAVLAQINKTRDAINDETEAQNRLTAAVGAFDRANQRARQADTEGLSAQRTKAIEEETAAWKKLNEQLTFIAKNQPALDIKPISKRTILQVEQELPENLSPDEMTTGFQEWAAAVGLTSKAIEELKKLLSESGPLVAGVAAGFEAFAQQAQIAFDLTANVADATFRSMMDLVDKAGNVFGQFFDDLIFSGKKLTDTFGDFFIALGKLVESVVKMIMIELAKAIARAIVVKIIMTAIGLDSGGSIPFARGGTVKMAEGGTVGTAAPAPTSPAAVLAQIFRPIARLALGGSVPRTVEAAAAYPPLARGASGFTVPGAIQVFDKVPALLSPGEVVLPTVAGKSPADLLGELAGLARLLKGEEAQSSRQRAATVNNVNIQAFNLDSLRDMVRHGDLSREQMRAFDLGRA